MSHSIIELIRHKRDGNAMSVEQLHWIVRNFTSGAVERYQMSAFLMAVFFQGMDSTELSAWTQAMLHSGDTLDLSEVPYPKIDKHSTGGVGDKVSIPLAPIVAACGVAVPMVSGRGLGHTGGTLDKLESIAGFDIDVIPRQFIENLQRHQLVLAGQSSSLVPADREIYALRDASGTVPSIPLIASSIMSKKLAEDLDGLVLDIKVGQGAFMKSIEEATELAETIAELGRSNGIKTVAHLTAMDQPLGNKIGNSLEIVESIEVLRGDGPGDLVAIVTGLAVEMLMLSGLTRSPDRAVNAVNDAIANGSAFNKFCDVVAAQGGDVSQLVDPSRLPRADSTHVISAGSSGFVRECNALEIGQGVVRLGGGRTAVSDSIDHAVGVELVAKVGDKVEQGASLGLIHYSTSDQLAAALPSMESAWTISPDPVERPKLLLGRIG